MRKPRFPQHRQPHPLTEEQARLAETCVDYATRLAKAFASRHRVRIDDAESDALFGLCKAAAEFDPSLGLTFANYARHRIEGEMHDGLRRARPRSFRRAESWPETHSLGDRLSDEAARLAFRRRGRREDAGVTYDEVCGRRDESFDGVDYQDLVDRLARRLPVKFQAVWRAIHAVAHESPQRDAAAACGLRYSRGSQIYNEGNALLRQALAGRDVA